MGSDKKQLSVFEYAGGKVLGGQLAEEAKHEVRVAQLLAQAWKAEFSKAASPFRIPLACQEFDAYVVDREKPGAARIVRLAETMWASAETVRLDSCGGLLPPQGLTAVEYIGMVASTVADAVMVMHKRLGGAFSSTRGTSISFGNVTLSGYVYDYETAQLPAVGNPSSLEEFQLQDLCGGLEIVAGIAHELDDWDLLVDAYQTLYLRYTQQSREAADYRQMVEHVRATRSVQEFPRDTIREMALAMIRDAAWR